MSPAGAPAMRVHGQSSLDLSPGDRVYLYSDGLFEVWNADDELFEQERLLECVARGGGLALEKTLDAAIESARAWSAGGRLTDDVAIVGLEFDGAGL